MKEPFASADAVTASSSPVAAVGLSDEGEGNIAYRIRALAVLTLVYTCAAIDRNVLAVILEPIKREFALSDGQAGLLAGGAFAFSFAVTALPIGYLIDRWHRVRLLSGLLTVWSMCTTACVTAQSYPVLVLLRAGVGAAESGASPSSLSLLSDIFPARQRAMAMGVFNASSALGVVLAFGLGGWLAQHHGWRAVMLMAGVPGLVLAVSLLLCVREPSRHRTNASGAQSAAEPPKFVQVYRFFYGQRALVHLFAGGMLAACVTAGIVSWLASFLQRVHGMDVRQAGLIVALTLGVLGIVSAVGGGWLGDRVAVRGGPKQRVVLCASSLAASVPFGLFFLLTGSVTLALPAMAIWGTFVLAYVGPSYATLLTLVPPRMRGLTAATQVLLAVLVGSGLGPWLVGLLSDRLGGGIALRHAMACEMLIGLWSAWHFYRSRLTLDADILRAAGGSTAS